MENNCFVSWLITVFLSLPAFNSSIAQMTQNDSAFYRSAISNAIDQYHSSSGDQNALFNGSLYYGYPFRFKQGNALFFPDTLLLRGSVVYDGIRYNDIALEYDNMQDLVITQDSLYWVQLNSKKINEFELAGHQFIRLEKNDLNHQIPVTGFYEILYNARTSVLKKEIKSIHEEPSIVEGLERSVVTSTVYFIKKNGIIYTVKGEDDILNILQDKSKDLRQFMKNNKLKFRKDKENVILQSVMYYEQLTKQI